MSSRSRRAAAIRHVHFEDVGTFASPLAEAGYGLSYHEAASDPLLASDLMDADLLIVLGGPISAYDEHTYPFVREELRLIETRLARGRPILAICLGAQLVARALGASVYPALAKEIGWGPITLTRSGTESALRHLDRGIVLHWHGDTFDLPAGATRLASTELCENQAFAHGDSSVLALQFHIEVDQAGFEHWLVGHAAELAGAKIDPVTLREAAADNAAGLAQRSHALLTEWLQGLA